MDDIETWFFNEFNSKGFTLSQSIVDPYTFSPHKRVLFKDGDNITYVGVNLPILTVTEFNDRIGNDVRTIVIDTLNSFWLNKKNFTPIKKIGRFDFIKKY